MLIRNVSAATKKQNPAGQYVQPGLYGQTGKTTNAKRKNTREATFQAITL
jgi:hypothetical protein